MTFWEYLGTRCQQLLVGAYQHAGAVFPCMVVATVLGVLIGVLTYRTEGAGNLAITMTASILTSSPWLSSACSSRSSAPASRRPSSR